VIKTDHFYAPEPIDGTVYIEVNNSRIEQVSFEPPESGVELVDLTDYVVGPGFVDVHIHGFAGHDTMEGTLEAISSMAEKLASTGTTAFLPTTTGAPVETLKPIMQLSNSFAQVKGAKPLALHLEGPFISKKVPGAMDPNLFRQANRDDIIELLSEGKALMVTMAPEIEGHLDMIELFAGYGVSVSLGQHVHRLRNSCQSLCKRSNLHNTLLQRHEPISTQAARSYRCGFTLSILFTVHRRWGSHAHCYHENHVQVRQRSAGTHH